MARNERTSARVAKIAGRILAVEVDPPYSQMVLIVNDANGNEKSRFSWKDIRALAASCLTQTKDKKAAPKKRRKARK